MDTKDEELIKRLQAIFRVEAEEHIRRFSSLLIELENNKKTAEIGELTENIFRETHSLKGAARSVGMKDIEAVCHVLEDIFGKIKKEAINLTAKQFDILHKATDSLIKMIAGSEKKAPGEHRELIKQLRTITSEEEQTVTSEGPETPDTNTSEENNNPASVLTEEPPEDVHLLNEELQIKTVRIPTAVLDQLFLQAEQLVQYKITAEQRTADLMSISDFISSWKTEMRKSGAYHSEGDPQKLQDLLSWNESNLHELATSITDMTQAMEDDQHLLGRMIDDHLDSTKKVLMLPVSTLTEGFPQLVRNLARSQDKEVELIVHGKEIEVDKRIMEELKDPLIHLIRNCIDHGIKKPVERQNLNKPSSGKVILNFNAIESRHLEISISDDGEGIDIEKVRNAAIKAGVLSIKSLDKLDTQETLMLIFQSGVSTSPIITDISGRGLGLAIVREKVEKLGGSVSVESSIRNGTTFRLELPLTLSTFRCVLLNTGRQMFAVPTIHIEHAIRINSEDMKTIENRETIMVDGEIIIAANLAKVLEIANTNNDIRNKKNEPESDTNFIQLLILAHAGKRIAYIVDDILGEYQIVVKEMGKQLSRVRNITGAAVLGSGKVVPVINVSDLMNSAMHLSVSGRETREIKTKIAKKYKILVVDDSITSRTLIKNIVETSGYIVETAVDGTDAFAKALRGNFDLIVSDVDMPRMSGFELTAKIRKDRKLSELPVVLVTALESKEDLEHGLDVGANAYIIKSSFDQSNLLEVIKKLL